MYGYEHMNSFKYFFDDKLPDRCKFHSSLKDKCISDKNYLYAGNIWDMSEIKTMGDYHDLHVLLLSDVFEKFLSACIEYYSFDPCNYFSSPGLSRDAIFKMTGMRLELIPDIDMYFYNWLQMDSTT